MTWIEEYLEAKRVEDERFRIRQEDIKRSIEFERKLEDMAHRIAKRREADMARILEPAVEVDTPEPRSGVMSSRLEKLVMLIIVGCICYAAYLELP